MAVEPQYGLPVERAGDREGWSVVDGEPGDRLAERIAAEIDRIESDIANFQAVVSALPRNIQSGTVAMYRSSFQQVSTSFYNTAIYRAAESVIFAGQFDAPPAVVPLWNFGTQPGIVIEVSVTEVTTSGCTVTMAASSRPESTFTARWLAVERTQ